MDGLIGSLKHQVARSGLMLGVEPWVEINVGQDGVPRGSIRNQMYSFDADGLIRAVSRVMDLPAGSQIIFSFEHEDYGFARANVVVVTTDPVTLIDRAVNLLSGYCAKVIEIKPGFARCLIDYVGEHKTLKRRPGRALCEAGPPPKDYKGRSYEPGSADAKRAVAKVRGDIKAVGAAVWGQTGAQIRIGATDKQANHLKSKGYGVYPEKPEQHNSNFDRWASGLPEGSKFWVLSAWELSR